MRKKRVIFPFVEAGLGHIMPMTAVVDAFEKKYGSEVEIVKTRFFHDTNDENMEFVEEELIKEVKLHNAIKGRGNVEFRLMDMIGSKNTMKYVMEHRYKRGLAPSMEYLAKLNGDLIFNTHFATLFYSCEGKKQGLLCSDVMAYCPDPIIGKQWDTRCDLMCLSSEIGEQKAIKEKQFKKENLSISPFLIRDKVKGMTKSREFYREEMNLPKDNFTVLLADGAYGAGQLEKTVNLLLKSKSKMTIVAVCGKNQELFERFQKYEVPKNITFAPFGFTEKMLELSASCDLFVGKAGASNLAEPTYFLAPSIVTFCATPIEKWIAEHYVKVVKCAQKITNLNKVIKIVESYCDDRTKMQKYIDECIAYRDCTGAEKIADLIFERLNKKNEK